jgi:hypothetical protein
VPVATKVSQQVRRVRVGKVIRLVGGESKDHSTHNDRAGHTFFQLSAFNSSKFPRGTGFGRTRCRTAYFARFAVNRSR